MHRLFSLTTNKGFHMVYGSLLMFIFSCSQSSSVYRAIPIVGDTTQFSSKNSNQKNNLKKTSKKVPKYRLHKAVRANDSKYPLHKAVRENDYKKVEAILAQYERKGKDVSHMRVNEKDDQGYLPIHWAMEKNFHIKLNIRLRQT